MTIKIPSYVPKSVIDGFFINEFVDYWVHVEPLKNLLTSEQSKTVWLEIERLNIDPQKFIFNFWHSSQDNEMLDYFKQKAIEAEKVEQQLQKTLKLINESQYNSYLPEHKKAISEMHTQLYEKRRSYERNCEVKRLTNDANIIFFQRKLADFFVHYTKNPQYDLIALCASIAFEKSKKTFDYQSVYQTLNRNRKWHGNNYGIVPFSDSM